MANLKYSDKHNMVAFLKKPNGSDDFHEIVDFLKRTPLRYALTHNPTIYDSLVKQFWQTATVRTIANGNQELLATIDGKAYTITEASVRSSLQLADATGITNLPDAEIHEGLATMGYVSDGTLTFWKKHFTPQWKFLIHTILHCMSPKSGGWDQFSSNIATTLICLSSNRVYNFSKLTFDGMVNNLDSKFNFLMYPRFLQMILGIRIANTGQHIALVLIKKIFGNMKRGFEGNHVPLLPAMLAPAQGEGLAIPAGSQPTPTVFIPSTSQKPIPPLTEPSISSPSRITDRQEPDIPQSQCPTPTPVADEVTTTSVEVDAEGAATTTASLEARLDSGNIHESPLRPHDAPLPEVNTSGSIEDSVKLKELMELVPKLVLQIDSLEKELTKTTQIFGNEVLTLKNKGKKSQDDRSKDFITPSEFSASGEAQEHDISPTLLDAAKTLTQVASGGVSTYKRRRRKGKAKMVEEDVQTVQKTKKKLEQEKAGFAEGIRLQAQLDVEVAEQIYIDEMIAKRIEEETEMTNQQKQRMAQVQFEAQYYTEEDWDVIKAKLEVNAKLVKNMQGEDLSEEDFAKRMVDMVNQRKKYFAEERAKAKRTIKARMKRYSEELQTGTSKKQKIIDDSGSAELQEKVAAKDVPVTEEKARETTVPKEEEEDSKTDKEEDMEAIGAIPVATKSPSVVNWKIF
ncbi:hypothetical protein Tco_1054748 [Tanacetum coccineum]|uniref:Synaptobrevin, longin-like domain protein n=1 Tax=Tanacetum coccineum TaxID=301880 RepID=A0ABQ5GXP3_9ASTR